MYIEYYNKDNKMRRESEEEKFQAVTPLLSPNKTQNIQRPIFKRLKVLKNKKISTINEQIKSRVNRQENKPMNSNSQQLPMRLTLREQLTVDPKITTSNFFVQVFSPKLNTPPSSKLEIRRRQVSMSSNKSGSSRYSRQRASEHQNNRYSSQIKKLSCYLSQQKLQKRLSQYSKQHGKLSIRVYKQDIHKIISHRFGKDRITTFLDTQYIEDFNSVLKTMKQLVSLKKQQILVFTFLIIDQNRDGLITPDDLINLIGAKKEGTPTFNQLIMSDLLKIIQYIERKKSQGQCILDEVANSILKDQGLTFMKYRINKFRQRKLGDLGEIKRAKFLTCRLKDHLYSLREQSQQQNHIITQFNQKIPKLAIQDIFLNFLKNNSKKNEQAIFGEKQKFAINFQRYSQIFGAEIPKIFLDFLYTLGGLQVPGHNYLQIDTTVLINNCENKKIVQEQNKMQKVFKRLQQMNSFKRQLKILRIKTQ